MDKNNGNKVLNSKVCILNIIDFLCVKDRRRIILANDIFKKMPFMKNYVFKNYDKLFERRFESRLQKEIKLIDEGFFGDLPIFDITQNIKIFANFKYDIRLGLENYTFDVCIPDLYPIKRPIIKIYLKPHQLHKIKSF
ncbi:MAG: hypothetical protein WCH77_12300, partial [Planctomycetota bacterium]